MFLTITLDETPKQRPLKYPIYVEIARNQIHDDGHAIAEHSGVGRLLLKYFELLDIHGHPSSGYTTYDFVMLIYVHFLKTKHTHTRDLPSRNSRFWISS